MRQLWSRGPLLAALGVVALVAGAWLGVVRDDPPDDVADRPAPPETLDLGEVLDFVPGCRLDSCQVLARRGGFRFQAKDATLIQAASRACESVGLHLVTAHEVLWSHAIPGLCSDPIGGIERDRTSNAFLKIPGEGDTVSVLVLRVRGSSVDDFGSFSGRFRGAEGTGARDLDGDGVTEVVVASANGSDDKVFRWDGREYRAASGSSGSLGEA